MRNEPTAPASPLANGLTDIHDRELLEGLQEALESPFLPEKDSQARKLIDEIFLEMRLGPLLVSFVLAVAGSGAAALLAFMLVHVSFSGR
jgi:hypothetical protein